MKKLITTCLCAFALYNAEAKTWRLNSDLAINADFRSLQTAHDDAKVLNGDTLHLEDAPISYGDLTCKKKLIIIGTGHSISENANLQYHSRHSIANFVTFEIGSENSHISGVTFDIVVTIASNIRISRCYVGITLNIGRKNNEQFESDFVIVENCKIKDMTLGAFASHALIINNIIEFIYSNIGTNYSATINNNIIKNLSSVYNCTLNNNVFTAPGSVYNNGNSFEATTNRFNNNIFPNVPNGQNPMSPGSNNKFSIDLVSVFVKYPALSDVDYTLKAGSPAIGTGVNGVDCGIFGGASPYVLSGIPAIPTIYNISLPATSTGNTLQGTISTRSNK